jgi:hypothetical protein
MESEFVPLGGQLKLWIFNLELRASNFDRLRLCLYGSGFCWGRLHPKQGERGAADPKGENYTEPQRGDRRANQNHHIYKILHPGS